MFVFFVVFGVAGFVVDERYRWVSLFTLLSNYTFIVRFMFMHPYLMKLVLTLSLEAIWITLNVVLAIVSGCMLTPDIRCIIWIQAGIACMLALFDDAIKQSLNRILPSLIGGILFAIFIIVVFYMIVLETHDRDFTMW